MGKFINTTRKDTIDNIIEGYKERIKNPYYAYTDKKATIVTYFNKNVEASTLDEALKIAESQLGINSPFKYNKIDNFYLFGGIEQIQIQLENGEFGLEGNTVEGSSIVLPNTIIPIPGDHFTLSYLEEDYLFRVTSVSIDTIESGANFYKIEYEYDKDDNDKILSQVENEFNMVITNIGTNFKTIIKRNDYKFIEILDDLLARLKQYYMRLFYSERVETFILYHDGANFYDPYMMEFIIRNNLMYGNGDKYLHLEQQMTLPRTFVIDYDTSIYRCLETFNKNKINNDIYAFGRYIDQPLSILSMKKEEYYCLYYVNEKAITENYKFNIFNKRLIENIINNKLFTPIKKSKPIPNILNNEKKYKATLKVINDNFKIYRSSVTVIEDDDIIKYRGLYDIIIKFFNNKDISTNDIDIIENTEFVYDKPLFYIIPIIIYILEYHIKKKLTK